MAKKPKINKTPASVFLGKEPKLDVVTGRNDPNLPKILNWYNYQFDNTQAKEWLIKYLQSENVSNSIVSDIRKLPDWAISSTSGWLAKMAINGTVLADENKQFIIDKANFSISKYGAKYLNKSTSPDKQEIASVTIQDRVAHKNAQLFAQYEEQIDQYMETGKCMGMYDFLKAAHASPVAANFIKSKYEVVSEDFKNPDAQLKEAYGRKLAAWTTFYQTIVDDCERYVGNRKAAKPKVVRATKIKPIAKIVEKVKYQKEDNSLKIVSISPEKIIGASQLWLYNTQYRKLIVYNAVDPVKGFSIKGTTIQDYDEKTSQSKTLRKPAEGLQKVLQSTKFQLGKVMDSIKSVPSTPNGRINENCVILRAVI